MNQTVTQPILPLQWANDHLRILDQRKLPAEIRWLEARDSDAVGEAIAGMAVRGAPAIGIAAAYGVCLAVRDYLAKDDEPGFEAALIRLADARPTAVNLHWAIDRMRQALVESQEFEDLVAVAQRIAEQDREMNRAMAALGAAKLLPGARVFTHCNTGSLATGGFGTALGVIMQAAVEDKLASVHFTETRPWQQGARLTAWELSQAGVRGRLITEGAAGHVMRTAGIDWLIVGADRIAANGDVANKIGTYGLARLAKAHGAKVMVVAPTSTVDMSIQDGEEITIENRPAGEILAAAGMDEPPAGITVVNPAFDITPAECVDLLVTDRGVLESPDKAAMKHVFRS
ncbi:MAG: S-methyl-5-thioribose-1-phosphate isomerase [Gammaproteobacteria bacterium]|nr:S-methyl-5-thioribose-1-phosphate isomerase [Gammaproteobacteria bacterium]